jgi:hypothetical protein
MEKEMLKKKELEDLI